MLYSSLAINTFTTSRPRMQNSGLNCTAQILPKTGRTTRFSTSFRHNCDRSRFTDILRIGGSTKIFVMIDSVIQYWITSS